MTSYKAPKTATWVGAFSLLCWASGSSMLASLYTIPIFQILMISLGLSFLLTCVKLTYQKRWHCIKKPPWGMWLIVIAGIYGNDLCLVTATKFAPPAHVHLLSYLWPTFVVVFSGFLPKERWQLRYIIAGIIGLYGVFLLMTQGQGFYGFAWDYRWGYAVAVLGASVWSVYSLLIRHYGETPSEMIGMACGVGALCSLIGHLQFETFVMPTSNQWGLLIMIGSTTSCMAFYFWDYGAKFGNIRLLSLLSYINPLLALGLLAYLGKAELSSSLGLAALIIVAAPVIASIRVGAILTFLGQFGARLEKKSLAS